METTGYYKNLDENFSSACELIDNNQSHTELVKMLESGNIVQKQLAALKLDTVYSQEEARILLNNLTGQDGKVREAVSLKIAELSSDLNLARMFEPAKNYKVLLEAIIDINGNICRNIIHALKNFKSDTFFCNVFCPELLDKTLKIADKVKDFDLQEGKYKINKEVFKLYWYLETIYFFTDCVDIKKLTAILNITKSINDYTIREKTAKILTKDIQGEELDKIRNLLKNDTNYYVRRF